MQTNNETELVIAFSLLHAHWVKRLDQSLGIHGISFTEFMVMYHLNSSPNQTMRRIDLADSIRLSASGVTRLLAPMHKIKLVEKESNPRDARVSLVRLSKAGKQIFNDALVSFKETAKTLFHPLNEREISKFLGLVNRLN
jgi:DNA-binding MarR family transcriptional regulator